MSEKPKITTIGGQAVIEGVMMRGTRFYAMAVRKPDNEIELVEGHLTPASDKFKPWGWPVIRGVIKFGEALVMGMKLITKSAEIAAGPDGLEPETKFEKWLEDKFGDKLMDVMLTISVVLAIGLSLLLFFWLPVWITSIANRFIGEHTWALGVIEGFVKISIFVAYVWLISRSKEIQRVFQYHGAEHKTITCFEHHEPLTVENVRKYPSLHRRCGTSFLIIVMIISMIVFAFVTTPVIWMRFGYRLLLIPVIAGISFEIIRWAGRSDAPIVGIISWPGMMIQRLTTKEPDDAQIEIAIAAMSEVLKHESEQP
ncbi:MAG: DUF1385 domain-containing protein [Defluviitaleaceae bacterium]|nr:DUF1385 domain-containing protein [Defluviitaleaceae bacterium]